MCKFLRYKIKILIHIWIGKIQFVEMSLLGRKSFPALFAFITIMKMRWWEPVVRSFNRRGDSQVERPTRQFYIEGSPYAIQHAVDIICQAVKLYKDLTGRKPSLCDSEKASQAWECAFQIRTPHQEPGSPLPLKWNTNQWNWQYCKAGGNQVAVGRSGVFGEYLRGGMKRIWDLLCQGRRTKQEGHLEEEMPHALEEEEFWKTLRCKLTWLHPDWSTRLTVFCKAGEYASAASRKPWELWLHRSNNHTLAVLTRS